MLNYDEIIKMFDIEDEKVYFSNKGLVNAENVEFVDDYVWSEYNGILFGSEFNSYVVLREGKELALDEYLKFDFTYIDKIEIYNESGQKYEKDKSCKYYNEGVNLKGCEVYLLYNNFNNNKFDSYSVEIYTIK